MPMPNCPGGVSFVAATVTVPRLWVAMRPLTPLATVTSYGGTPPFTVKTTLPA